MPYKLYMDEYYAADPRPTFLVPIGLSILMSLWVLAAASGHISTHWLAHLIEPTANSPLVVVPVPTASAVTTTSATKPVLNRRRVPSHSNTLDSIEPRIKRPRRSAAMLSDNFQMPGTEHVEHIVVYPDELEGLRSVSEDAAYHVSVRHAFDDSGAELPPGMKRVTVTADLGNESGPAVMIRRDSVALVEPSGQFYRPLPDTGMNPALVDSVVAAGDSISGFASFDIPVDLDTSYAVVELCINQSHPCDGPLQAALP